MLVSGRVTGIYQKILQKDGNFWQIPSPCCWVEGYFATIISHSAFRICLSHPFLMGIINHGAIPAGSFWTQPLGNWFLFAKFRFRWFLVKDWQIWANNIDSETFRVPSGFAWYKIWQCPEKKWRIFMSWFFCLTQPNKRSSLRVYIAPNVCDLCT